MESRHFFNPLKFSAENNCGCFEETGFEIKSEVPKVEIAKQDTVLPSNFQWFDLDQVFAN